MGRGFGRIVLFMIDLMRERGTLKSCSHITEYDSTTLNSSLRLSTVCSDNNNSLKFHHTSAVILCLRRMTFSDSEPRLLLMTGQQQVAYVLSIGTKMNDLGRP